MALSPRLALHLVGLASGEVLLPPLSFVATANAIAHLGAVPHFVDIEHNSSASALLPWLRDWRLLLSDAKALVNKETGRRTGWCYQCMCLVMRLRLIIYGWWPILGVSP